MKISANIDSVKLIDWHINTGEVNARVLDVEMSEELKSCSVAFVTFKTENEGTYESKVNDGVAEIPSFSESQWVEIGLYTSDMVNGELKKQYSPKPAKKFINKGSFSAGAEEPPKPTPSDYSALLSEIAKVDEKIAEGTENVNTALADLKKGTIKVLTGNVNLWELETGIYYLEGGWNYTKGLGANGSNRHIFLIYKTSSKSVRYIHFCGNYRRDIWSRIECGYTDGTTRAEYSLIDSSAVTSNIKGDVLGTKIPDSAGVRTYVKEELKSLNAEILNLKEEIEHLREMLENSESPSAPVEPETPENFLKSSDGLTLKSKDDLYLIVKESA